MELSYFVEHDFEERFDRKQINFFESEIERKYKIADYENCGYKLHKSLIYLNPRTTKILKFTYFVGDDFDRRFNLQKVYEMETQIKDYIMGLKIKCTEQSKAQKGVNKFSGQHKDRIKRRINKSKFPSCVALEKLSSY